MMLFVFLLGIAIGAMSMYLWMRRPRHTKPVTVDLRKYRQ